MDLICDCLKYKTIIYSLFCYDTCFLINSIIIYTIQTECDFFKCNLLLFLFNVIIMCVELWQGYAEIKLSPYKIRFKFAEINDVV